MNRAMASSWHEPVMDAQCGRLPLITASSGVVTFELSVLGGILRDELFNPPPRTRLAIRCERDGHITMRILNGRSSGV